MALADKLDATEIAELAGNSDFLTELAAKLDKNKVSTILDKLDDKVVKTGELATKATAKEVVDAIIASTDFTGTVYTKIAADAAFVKATELATKAAAKPVVDAITASTDFTGTVYTKTTADAAFVKAGELATKAAEGPVVNAITSSTDFTGKVYTKAAADTAFVKTGELATKAAEGPVVNAITSSTDFTGKVYTKAAADTAFVKTGELATKAAEGPVVNAIISSTDFTGKVYTKAAADTAFVKTDGTNISTQTDKGKTLANAILAVEDSDKKSVLVEKLGGFLENITDSKYGASTNQTAKAFLVSKGIGPTPAELAGNTDFMSKITINITDEKIREVMSQPVFYIPEKDTEPLSQDWPLA